MTINKVTIIIKLSKLQKSFKQIIDILVTYVTKKKKKIMKGNNKQ